MDTLTTTIKREFLREIVARRKRIEYRAIKPYWTTRLAKVGRPFKVRLINGMQKNAPEVTVTIAKVRKNLRWKAYELHISRIETVRNWDRRRERPKL